VRVCEEPGRWRKILDLEKSDEIGSHLHAIQRIFPNLETNPHSLEDSDCEPIAPPVWKMRREGVFLKALDAPKG
jgi:hypothetical protein